MKVPLLTLILDLWERGKKRIWIYFSLISSSKPMIRLKLSKTTSSCEDGRNRIQLPKRGEGERWLGFSRDNRGEKGEFDGRQGKFDFLESWPTKDEIGNFNWARRLQMRSATSIEQGGFRWDQQLHRARRLWLGQGMCSTYWAIEESKVGGFSRAARGISCFACAHTKSYRPTFFSPPLIANRP